MSSDPALVEQVAKLLADFDIDPNKPVRKQILVLRGEPLTKFSRRFAELPGTTSEKEQAIIEVRGRATPATLVTQLRYQTAFVNRSGKPVRITGPPNTKYVMQITDANFADGTFTTTVMILEGETEELDATSSNP